MPATIQKDFAVGDLSDAVDEAVEETLRRFGLILERRIKEELDAKDITVSGQAGTGGRGGIKGSVSHAIDQERGAVVLKVGPTVDYAIYVLEGTRPHWAPIAPLKTWTRKKLGVSSEELDEVAYKVQAKIAREGTDPQDYLTGPMEETIDEVVEALLNDLQQKLAE
jgi:hypothetical protein